MPFQIDFKALEGDDSSLDQHQRDQLEVAKTIGPVLMCSAAAADDVAQVRGLLNHGISPSMSDYDGRSGLHVAAAEGAGEVIAVLIDAGAQLSCADRFGRTPLEEAVRHRRGNTAKQLRKAGAEMSMTDSDLSSLLCHCGSTGDSVMLELLHSVGCDLNTADYDGACLPRLDITFVAASLLVLTPPAPSTPSRLPQVVLRCIWRALKAR